MKLVSPENLRQIQLEILDDIQSFCKENSIRFSLAYGSLLGAIRHNGFIPWDDDIDLMMPRPDYDRFVNIYQSKFNEVLDLAESPLCVEMFAKVCRKKTRMTDTLGRSLWGINVDIFPIDGFPGQKGEQRYLDLDRCNRAISTVCPFYKTVGNNKVRWFLKYVIKRILHPSLPSVLSIKHAITAELRKETFDSSPLAGAYFGDAGLDEFMEKRIFSHFTEYPFEGRMLPVPVEYDAYLRYLFGDYMTLPPEEERQSHHLYSYYFL